MGDISIYLKPTEFFDFDKPKVRSKAFEITKGLKTQKEQAIALFYWVRDEIKYNMKLFIPSIKNNFKASKVLQKRQGFCVSKSILLSSLARVLGIPARIHLVDLINHLISQKIINFMGTNVMYYHGFSEFYLNNKWIKLTPSFDKETAIKGGFLPMVEFDGDHDAVFPPYDINGKKFGEYVGDRGIHADLPLNKIDEVFREKYRMFREYLTGAVKLDTKNDLI
jgi:hypothetical protein